MGRWLVGVLLAACPTLAVAQVERQVAGERQIEVQLYGGVVDFPGVSRINPGGAYGIFVGVDPWELIELELGYQGAAYTEQTPPGRQRAVALENGGYGAVKLSPRAGPVEPYALAGVGLSHINAVDQAEGGVLQDDTVAKLPLALGVDIRVETFSVGVRGTWSFLFANQNALETGADQLFGTVHLGSRF